MFRMILYLFGTLGTSKFNVFSTPKNLQQQFLEIFKFLAHPVTSRNVHCSVTVLVDGYISFSICFVGLSSFEAAHFQNWNAFSHLIEPSWFLRCDAVILSALNLCDFLALKGSGTEMPCSFETCVDFLLHSRHWICAQWACWKMMTYKCSNLCFLEGTQSVVPFPQLPLETLDLLGCKLSADEFRCCEALPHLKQLLVSSRPPSGFNSFRCEQIDVGSIAYLLTKDWLARSNCELSLKGARV